MYSPPPVSLIIEKYAETSIPASGSYTISSPGIYLAVANHVHLIDAEYYHSASASWVKVGVNSGNFDYGMQVQPNFISDGQNARIYNRNTVAEPVVIMRCR